MLDTLKFVRGAVSAKDLVPVLTHFFVRDGRLQGQNGRLTLDAPCPELGDKTMAVPADKFLRAVDACEGEPKITIKDDRVTISRGRFRATLGLAPEASYPEVEPMEAGALTRSGAGLLDLLRRAHPFISTDASRPWSCSLLVTADTTFATNNVVLACFDFGWGAPDLIIPAYCVEEMIRIGEDPVRVSWDAHRLYAEYSGGRWLSSLLVDGGWPESLHELQAQLEAVPEEEWEEVTDDLLPALDRLKPFFPDAKQPVVVCDENGVSTREGVSQAVVGLDGMPERAVYRLESLSLALSQAAQWAPRRWPGPTPWRGEKVVGMLSGVRM